MARSSQKSSTYARMCACVTVSRDSMLMACRLAVNVSAPWFTKWLVHLRRRSAISTFHGSRWPVSVTWWAWLHRARSVVTSEHLHDRDEHHGEGDGPLA